MSGIVLNRNQASNAMLLDTLIIESLVIQQTQQCNPPPSEFVEARTAFNNDLANFLESEEQELDMSNHIAYMLFFNDVLKD